MESWPKMEPQHHGSAIALAVAAAAAFFSIYSLRPPAPLPDNAPPGEFWLFSALRHVRHIAATPHPTGGPANASGIGPFRKDPDHQPLPQNWLRSAKS